MAAVIIAPRPDDVHGLLGLTTCLGDGEADPPSFGKIGQKKTET
jgi:hypothetical protein